MIFDRLADGIQRHAKLIIVFWAVVLVISAPFAIKGFGVMSYDFNDMANEDSESMQGIALISTEFPTSTASATALPITVFKYEDVADIADIDGYVEWVNAKLGASYAIGDMKTTIDGEEYTLHITSLTGPDRTVYEVSEGLVVLEYKGESRTFTVSGGTLAAYDDASVSVDISKGSAMVPFIGGSAKFTASVGMVTSGDTAYMVDKDQFKIGGSAYVVDLEAGSVTPLWGAKVTAVMTQDPSSDEGEGIVLGAVVYNAKYLGGITNDTPNLRNFLNQEKNAYFEDVGKDPTFALYITGMTAIGYDMMNDALNDVSKIDVFSVLFILVLVGLFFRSFITSATPPITIGFAFAITMALVFLIAQFIDIFFITNMLILVTMMGAGCDYCIFIISRYREELRSGKNHDEALHESIVWAGESIATSGASVIIGFGAISVCSLSFVSTMGLCLALGILIALIAALTLIPSILAVIGDRIFWPSRMKTFEAGGKSTKGWYAFFGRCGQKYFEKSSRFSLKHAWVIVIAAILITVPAVYIMTTNEKSYDMISAMQSGDSGTGMDLMKEYADVGMLLPDWAIVEFDDPIGYIEIVQTGTGKDIGFGAGNIIGITWSDAYKDLKPTLTSMYDSILDIDNVSDLATVYEWNDRVDMARAAGVTSSDEIIDWIIDNETNVSVGTVVSIVMDTMKTGMGFTSDQIVNNLGPTIDYYINVNTASIGGDFRHNGFSSPFGTLYLGEIDYIQMTISTKESSMSTTSMGTISDVNSIINRTVKNSDGAIDGKWMTGIPVIMYEICNVVGGEFDFIELLVIVLILILLFVVMRSYTIPFRSVLTILMSVSWTIALTYIIFQNVLGGEVNWLAPLILFVVCLGLGMDYDILLTTRIKENVMSKGMTNDEGIHQAVTHTGSVITICGIIMGGAFGTLMMSSMELLQEFGFALCFAILVDALVVRTYIVPAVMHILGDWNWKGPGSKKRLEALRKQE